MAILGVGKGHWEQMGVLQKTPWPSPFRFGEHLGKKCVGGVAKLHIYQENVFWMQSIAGSVCDRVGVFFFVIWESANIARNEVLYTLW